MLFDGDGGCSLCIGSAAIPSSPVQPLSMRSSYSGTLPVSVSERDFEPGLLKDGEGCRNLGRAITVKNGLEL
jgi:hypothetical protein